MHAEVGVGMFQDKIDMKRPLGGGNAPLPSTGGHSRERRRASSPWHRSTVARTNDEQRGKLSERERSARLCPRLIWEITHGISRKPLTPDEKQIQAMPDLA